MKSLLTALSVLTIGTTTLNLVSLSHASINSLTNKSTYGNDGQSLFNNYYGVLDNSTNWWITNQSVNDQKYYSYDLSHAKYQLPDSHKDAYLFFIVDSNGLLQYTSDQKSLSYNDKNMLSNTKTEIENDKRVTDIQDSDNIYSKSIYSNNYFIGGNENWQFLQMGGVENHIDLSLQINGDKVEYYQDLSESLGLYYIAKAVIQQKIDEAVADNLAQYFISQSSLKNSKISDNLIKQIIRLIVHNNDIYNFIYNTPFTNSDKNVSLNLIFDNSNDNNLIEIYYYKWNKSNIINTLNYYYYNWTYVIFGSDNDSSNTHTLLNWSKYASTWDLFLQKYPTFIFDSNSYINLSVMGQGTDKFSTLKTNDILINQGLGDTNSMYSIKVGYPFGRYHFVEKFDLNIWHDNNNIYFKWFLTSIEGGSNYTIILNNIIFNNIMN